MHNKSWNLVPNCLVTLAGEDIVRKT